MTIESLGIKYFDEHYRTVEYFKCGHFNFSIIYVKTKLTETHFWDFGNKPFRIPSKLLETSIGEIHGLLFLINKVNNYHMDKETTLFSRDGTSVVYVKKEKCEFILDSIAKRDIYIVIEKKDLQMFEDVLRFILHAIKNRYPERMI